MKKDYSKYFIPSITKARKRTKNAVIKHYAFTIDKSLLSLGKNRTFFVKTYGCQSNIRDSEDIVGILKKMNFKLSPTIEKADLIILNTCAVRENAEKKVFGKIGQFKTLKQVKPQSILAVCGCMAQEEDVVNKIAKQLKQVDLVFGTHNIHMLPEMLNEVINQKQRVIHVNSIEGDVIEGLPIDRSSKIKAFVNIMFGCDKFCTYCIVPYTRGQIRSRTKDDILKEINKLIKDGYKEVTLLGQNVNSYGIDFNQNYHFWNLLEDVAKTKIPRVRFVTSNPWNFDLKIVDVMKKYSNIMPYIHLPIQSGDELILKQMNRSMKINDYLKTINYIKTEIPNCAISTDIIVGFPNETNKQFENTLKLYEKIKFDNAYTFIYSPRSGTSAALIKDQVSLVTKQERLSQLNEMVRKYAKWNNEQWVNKIVPVLVEGVSKTNDLTFTGYSPEWKVINFSGEAKVGEIRNILITSASRFSLNGKVV